MLVGCGETRKEDSRCIVRCLVSTTRWTVVSVTETEMSRKGTGVGENQEFWLGHIKFEMPISYPSREVKETIGAQLDVRTGEINVGPSAYRC